MYQGPNAAWLDFVPLVRSLERFFFMNLKQSKEEDQRNNDKVWSFLCHWKKALTCQEIDRGLLRVLFLCFLSTVLSTETLVVDHLGLVSWFLCFIHSSVALYDSTTKLIFGEFCHQVELLAFAIFKLVLNGVCE